MFKMFFKAFSWVFVFFFPAGKDFAERCFEGFEYTGYEEAIILSLFFSAFTLVIIVLLVFLNDPSFSRQDWSNWLIPFCSWCFGQSIYRSVKEFYG